MLSVPAVKRTLFIGLLIIVTACKEHDQRHLHPVSRFGRLLAAYSDVTFDSLTVTSSEDPGAKKNPFRGKQLDSTCIRLLPGETASLYDSGFYACYKFRIDGSKMGLITRTPSEYISSSIKLFILDEKQDSIAGYLELAELIADAGDVMDKSSLLFKDGNGKIQCIIWQQESHDNSVYDPKDTATDVSDRYYLVSLSGHRIDTTSTDSAILAKRWRPNR